MLKTSIKLESILFAPTLWFALLNPVKLQH